MIAFIKTLLRNLVSYVKSRGIAFILIMLSYLTFASSNNIYFVVLFCLCIIVTPSFYKVNNSEAWWILLFSLIYGFTILLQSTNFSNTNILSYCLAPICYYKFGLLVARENIRIRNYNRLMQFILLSIVAIGMGVYIDTFKDIAFIGLVNPTRSLATEDSQGLSATLYGLIASLGLSGLAYCFIKTKQYRSEQIFYIAIFVMSAIVTIHFVNRSAIVITCVVTAIMLMLFGGKNKGNVILCGIVIALLIPFFVDSEAFSDIESAYTNRMMDEENANSYGGRSQRWGIALSKLLYLPFGWAFNDVTYDNYAHNMWLDIARSGGIVPAIIMTIISVKILIQSYRLTKVSAIRPFAIFLLGLLLTISISCFVEPVIEAKAIFFYFYLMILGIISELYSVRKRIV